MSKIFISNLGILLLIGISIALVFLAGRGNDHRPLNREEERENRE